MKVLESHRVLTFQSTLHLQKKKIHSCLACIMQFLKLQIGKVLKYKKETTDFMKKTTVDVLLCVILGGVRPFRQKTRKA